MPPQRQAAAEEAPAAQVAAEAVVGAPAEEAAPEHEPETEAEAAGPALPEGMDAVGFRIAVFWPGDNTWCVSRWAFCCLWCARLTLGAAQGRGVG